MPNTSSAKKALRQNIQNRARNVAAKNNLKEVVKAYKKTPSTEALSKAYKALDKAAKTNLIKKNTASRIKSRLSKLVAKR